MKKIIPKPKRKQDNIVPSLTLSMIVKDEEKYIADCLESVKDVVDEIVVVDTGSQDNTVSIAKSYGANVLDFEWQNDFSKARNYALSKSNSDWVLYLDADERLDENSKMLIKKLINSNKKYGIRCSIYNIDEVNKKPKLQRYTRLFKNSDGIEFRGKAHEQIDASLLENNYKIIDSEVLIHHLGYNISNDDLKRKAARNLELLLEEYNENPTGYCAFQIGNSYNILQDKDQAYKYYNEAVTDTSLPHQYKSLSLSYCAEHYLNNNDVNRAVDTIHQAIKTDPDNIVSNLVASEIFFQLKKGEEAVHYCMKALDVNEQKKKLKPVNSLIEIYQDDEKIIYHGLNIAFQTNNQNGIAYFFDRLEKYKKQKQGLWEKEAGYIQKLSTSTQFTDAEVNEFINVVNDYSLEFYLSLLDKLEKNNTKIKIAGKLLEKFPSDIKVRNKYGIYLSESGMIDNAISVFEDTLKKYETDSSPVFYLVYLYLKKHDFNRLESLVEKSREKYRGNSILMQRLDELETKINLAKINSN